MKRRPNELRIIGGQWRGRRIEFPDAEGLRPTADRVRETVFNWLQAYLPGARCLDLFAGSGAMGIEALSRGADAVVFVERERVVADTIRGNLNKLGAAARVVQADALRLLAGPAEPFDIIFIDPPFNTDIIGRCCELLEQGGWLAPSAMVYIEQDRAKAAPAIPGNWAMHREARAGQVGFFLAKRQDASS
jgi:16S rRNA (guanine966-N2)-methyltransferase